MFSPLPYLLDLIHSFSGCFLFFCCMVVLISVIVPVVIATATVLMPMTAASMLVAATSMAMLFLLSMAVTVITMTLSAASFSLFFHMAVHMRMIIRRRASMLAALSMARMLSFMSFRFLYVAVAVPIVSLCLFGDTTMATTMPMAPTSVTMSLAVSSFLLLFARRSFFRSFSHILFEYLILQIYILLFPSVLIRYLCYFSL